MLQNVNLFQEFYEPTWVDTDEIGDFGKKVSRTVGEVRVSANIAVATKLSQV
jgi:hypothetical protein